MNKWMGDKPTECQACGGPFSDNVFHDAPTPKFGGSWALICTRCRGGGTSGQTYSTKKPYNKIEPAVADPLKTLAKHKSTGHFKMTLEQYNNLVASGNGICIACGANEQFAEPDARKHPCEICGKAAVYGVEELLMMGRMHLNPPDEKLNGYIGIYKGKQHEIYAKTTYEAQTKLAAKLKVKKAWEISVYLAEKGGEQVVHDPSILGNPHHRNHAGPHVFLDGEHWDVIVIDPTHVEMRRIGSTGMAWAYHVMQLDDETVRQLQAQGVMDARRYVKVSRGNPPYKKPTKVMSAAAEVMNLAKLPGQCFAKLAHVGLVGIVKGESGYRPVPQDLLEKFGTIDKLNNALGVTLQQREAMVVGSMFGWGVPGANPDNYDDEGTPKRGHAPNPPERCMLCNDFLADSGECGSCISAQDESAAASGVACEGCGDRCFESPCMDCVRSRHAGVVGRGCSCGKKRRPKLVDLGFRAFYSCERCLAPITSMRVKGSKER
jgi:hypothetical protein